MARLCNVLLSTVIVTGRDIVLTGQRFSVDKRKRRPSVVNEDEHIDIDADEPWSQSYVHIAQDIISDDETRVKLGN